eukprot:123245_1
MTTSRGLPPLVRHHPFDDAFTVSNVRNFENFDVDAPTLRYQIVAAGPNAYRVECKPTSIHLGHRVVLKADGVAFESFTMFKKDAAPSLQGPFVESWMQRSRMGVDED